MIVKARKAVLDYYNGHRDVTSSRPLEMEDVFCVWYNYTLGNWKALISTTVPDGMYYEVTYNKEKREMYLDAYKKWENQMIPD